MSPIEVAYVNHMSPVLLCSSETMGFFDNFFGGAFYFWVVVT
jgi:hypothetical protein